jgi:ADP-heptose:LPS heptosyltransferase
MRKLKKIILVNSQSPGDFLVMEAALHCLHQQYPVKYLTDVKGPAMEIYDNHPNITKLDENDPEVRKIEMHYPLIHRSDERPVHFMQGYVEYLSEQLDIPITLTCNHPHIYLSEEEKRWTNQIEEIFGYKGRFGVIISGVKQDFTAKSWGAFNYQKVVDMFDGKIQFVQVGEAHHLHKPLNGVFNLIGKTTTRQLIRLCYHAQFGVGPVTVAQHIFASLENDSPLNAIPSNRRGKYYISVAGAREPISWENYPTQQTMSSHGLLPCCRNKSCWVSRVIKLNDGDPKDNCLCELPVLTTPEPIPKCMELIRPEEVYNVIAKYFNNLR